METRSKDSTLDRIRSFPHGVEVKNRFSALERISSFKHAFRGVALVLRSQQNAWIHAAAGVAVIGLGLVLELPTPSWCWLVLAMALVWTSEAFNTALERLADAAVPELHPLIRDAKDAAAGAVLLAAAGAVVIGLLVLGPPLWALLTR
jgi:diacylglycerol kinase